MEQNDTKWSATNQLYSVSREKQRHKRKEKKKTSEMMDRERKFLNYINSKKQLHGPEGVELPQLSRQIPINSKNKP